MTVRYFISLSVVLSASYLAPTHSVAGSRPGPGVILFDASAETTARFERLIWLYQHIARIESDIVGYQEANDLLLAPGWYGPQIRRANEILWILRREVLQIENELLELGIEVQNLPTRREIEHVAEQPEGDLALQSISGTEPEATPPQIEDATQIAEQSPEVTAVDENDKITTSELSEGKVAIAKEILDQYGSLQSIRQVAQAADYAVLADAAYGIAKDIPYPEGSKSISGWTVVKNFVEESDGVLDFGVGDLHATLFRGDDGRYVLSFRGSQTLDDWKTNTAGTLIPVVYSAQIREAESLARRVSEVYPDVIFTGHSLGGRLANVANVATGNDSYVFDTAPLSIEDLVEYTFNYDNAGTIHSFRSPGDPLTYTTDIAQISVKESTVVENYTGYDYELLDAAGGLFVGAIYDHSPTELQKAMSFVKDALPWIEEYSAN